MLGLLKKIIRKCYIMKFKMSSKDIRKMKGASLKYKDREPRI